MCQEIWQGYKKESIVTNENTNMEWHQKDETTTLSIVYDAEKIWLQ